MVVKHVSLAIISILTVFSLATSAAERFFASESSALDAYVKANSKPFNLSESFANSRVIYIGENHNESISKNFLIAKMPALKALGFTHLGLEMFDVNAQPLLTRYENGTASDEEILEYLKENWGHIPQYYVNLVKAARNAGLHLTALDFRPERETIFIDRRDMTMAQTIASVIKSSPNNKVLALVGNKHVDLQGDRMTMYQPEILKSKFGLDSIAYRIAQRYSITASCSLKPGGHGDISKMLPGDPNLDCYDDYVTSNPPVRAAMKANSISTNETILLSRRQDSGFDGLLFLDRYEDKIKSPHIRYMENMTDTSDD
jgi:hypothetical protein